MVDIETWSIAKKDFSFNLSDDGARELTYNLGSVEIYGNKVNDKIIYTVQIFYSGNIGDKTKCLIKDYKVKNNAIKFYNKSTCYDIQDQKESYIHELTSGKKIKNNYGEKK
jgi:hypothetical protein